MRWIKSLILVGCAIVLGGFAGLFFYGKMLIQETDLDAVINSQISRQSEDATSGTWREGGSVKKDAFNFFSKIYLPDESQITNAKELLQLTEVDEHPGNYFFQKDIKYQFSKKNSCREIYCYQVIVPFETIPTLFWKILMSVEDRRFLDHEGVDYKSILRAIYVDIMERKLVQGGSTLTQQLVKNLFLHQKKTFLRKIKEIILSIYLESVYSKDQIIALYLNSSYWGTIQGVKIKGFYSASLGYFQKKPEELRPWEVATLIAMLKGPSLYHPLKKPAIMLGRLSTIQELVRADGIDLDYQKDPTEFAKKFQDIHQSYLLRDIWELEKYTFKFLEPYQVLALIRAYRVLATKLKLDHYSFKAVISSFSCVENCEIFSYYSRFERSLEEGIYRELHQVGSLIKPFLAATFLDLGTTFDEIISTEVIELKLPSGKWLPREVKKNLPREVTLRQALLDSLNRPFIRVAQNIGFDAIESNLQKKFPINKTPLSQFPAQLLGAAELSLADLLDRTKIFLRRGCVGEGASSEKAVIELLSDPNQNTLRKVVRPPINAMHFFAKTGTTNEGKSNWLWWGVGDWVGLFWFGQEEAQNTENTAPTIFGSTTSFQVFQEMMMGLGVPLADLQCSY